MFSSLNLVATFLCGIHVASGISFGNTATSTYPFGNGMILQRDGAAVWGVGASTEDVSVSIACSNGQKVQTKASVETYGTWTTTMTASAAVKCVVTVAESGANGATATMSNIAIGDVLLCGGQSNMGFGMCGAQSKTQSPQQALDDVGTVALRYFFNAGSGPNGGAGGKGCTTSSGDRSITQSQVWFTANATNSGGASANCMLTALYLQHKYPDVPIGGWCRVSGWFVLAPDMKDRSNACIVHVLYESESIGNGRTETQAITWNL
eukprot:m.253041 g.253041  ORF g.253041 m.253041 type:complete len:265 (-) comp19575_c0_seq5:104-898(-)